jgi:transposase
MATSIPNLYPVKLTPEQRERLDDITRHGRAPARKIRHAQVLLFSDHNRPGGKMTRIQVSQTLNMHINTVDRIRRRFVQEGEAPAVNQKVRTTPPTPPKLDGRGEAHLVAICCSKAPAGRTRWTLKLLANELVDRGIVTSICAETVRKTLKKTSFSLGARSVGAFPSATRHASSRRWKTSLICMNRSTRRKSR